MSSSAKNNWVGLQSDQDFFKKNEKLQRPMSGHIFIYKWPLPAVLSVFHRGTGVVQTLAISASAIILAAGGHNLDFYIQFVQVCHFVYIHLTKIQVSEYTVPRHPWRKGSSLLAVHLPCFQRSPALGMLSCCGCFISMLCQWCTHTYRQVWDTGKNIDSIKDVYKSAYAVIAVSGILACFVGSL
jgi:hypothetical protein